MSKVTKSFWGAPLGNDHRSGSAIVNDGTTQFTDPFSVTQGIQLCGADPSTLALDNKHKKRESRKNQLSQIK